MEVQRHDVTCRCFFTFQCKADLGSLTGEIVFDEALQRDEEVRSSVDLRRDGICYQSEKCSMCCRFGVCRLPPQIETCGRLFTRGIHQESNDVSECSGRVFVVTHYTVSSCGA